MRYGFYAISSDFNADVQKDFIDNLVEVLDIFYVSDCEEEWERDRADLREGYSFVFAANLSDSWLSEHGSIAFNVSGGGLIRVA